MFTIHAIKCIEAVIMIIKTGSKTSRKVAIKKYVFRTRLG